MYCYGLFSESPSNFGPDHRRPGQRPRGDVRRRRDHSADRDLVHRCRPGPAQPRARARGPQLRGHPAGRERGLERTPPGDPARGRDRAATAHGLRQPLPPQPLPELALRERRHPRPARLPLREPGPADRGYGDRPRDQRGRQAGEDVRQQWLLGHVSHRVAGVRVPLPGADRRAGRRVRAAVPRRRLDRPLVVAGVRGLHDRDELRRGVRRCVSQGCPAARPVGDVRRWSAQRDRRAGRDRGRPEGRGDRVLHRAT